MFQSLSFPRNLSNYISKNNNLLVFLSVNILILGKSWASEQKKEKEEWKEERKKEIVYNAHLLFATSGCVSFTSLFIVVFVLKWLIADSWFPNSHWKIIIHEWKGSVGGRWIIGESRSTLWSINKTTTLAGNVSGNHQSNDRCKCNKFNFVFVLISFLIFLSFWF